MSIKLDDMISKLTNLVKPSLYHININNENQFFAHTVTLPSRTLQIRADSNYIPGRTLNQPYATDITGLSVSFYSNHNGAVTKSDNLVYFQTWLAGTEGYSVINNPVGGTQQQVVQFFSDFAKNDIKIVQYGVDGNEICTWTFYKPYPKSVSYGELSYSATNSFMDISVEFDIADFVIENANGSTSSSATSSSVVGTIGTDGGSPFSALGTLSVGNSNSKSAAFSAKDLTSGKLPINNILNNANVANVANVANTDNSPSFLDQIKQTYTEGRESVSAFYRDMTENLDPNFVKFAKKVASTAVRNAINGTPTNFGTLAKQAAAGPLGDIASSVTNDPDIKRQIKQSTSDVVHGMPERLNQTARNKASNDIQSIINSA